MRCRRDHPKVGQSKSLLDFLFDQFFVMDRLYEKLIFTAVHTGQRFTTQPAGLPLHFASADRRCRSAILGRSRDAPRSKRVPTYVGADRKLTPWGLNLNRRAQAKEVSWMTHGHPSGFLSAGAFAAILHSLLVDRTVLDGVTRARSLLEREDDSSETVAAIDLAIRLAGDQLRPVDALPEIGGGWVGEEALGVALYCALTTGDFAAAVRMAVNHGGDSDTTGSLTGQLLGAIHGIDAIPAHWLAQLELRDLLTLVADDLIACHGWNLDENKTSELDSIWERYPGG
jgi:hypothetical protein